MERRPDMTATTHIPAATADQALACAKAAAARLRDRAEEVDRVSEATERMTKASHFVDMFVAVLAGR